MHWGICLYILFNQLDIVVIIFIIVLKCDKDIVTCMEMDL